MTKKEFEALLGDGWKKNEGYVFVSYASKDWEKVYPCVLALRSRGINVFIDAEFQENSSSSWLHNLEERLIRDFDCQGIVAFVSASYLGSYACLTELIANRTSTQCRLKGKPLPVFYIGLDEALSTPQRISAHIRSKAVRTVFLKNTVRIKPAEYTKMEAFLVDCRLENYPDRPAVRNLLDAIRNKYDVATIMDELIFSDTRIMPSIQLFNSADECAELLMRNFVNDKNESIELTVLEELRLETHARLDKMVENGQLPEPARPKLLDEPEKLEQTNQLKALAEAGDAGAQSNLGVCYENGQGVERDFVQAVYWYRKAAEQGYADAQNSLGVCYCNGQGVEQDWTQAVYWFRKAAEQGYANAQRNLGVCYENGQGVERDFVQTVYWFRKAAEQGYAEAQNSLGVCYYNGQGVEQDWTQAVYWFRKAAEQGHANAQSNLSVCYKNGQGVERDFVQAVYWYRKAAEQGYADAQNSLGVCYYNGQGVEQDWTQAVYWFRKAAEQGHANAQSNLSVCYENGQGVERDFVQAVYWYRKAAEQGYAEAQNSLGVCYYNGQGVEQDWTQAVYWFRKAAEQGHANAQHNLGVCYKNGHGVEQCH